MLTISRKWSSVIPRDVFNSWSQHLASMSAVLLVVRVTCSLVTALSLNTEQHACTQSIAFTGVLVYEYQRSKYQYKY